MSGKLSKFVFHLHNCFESYLASILEFRIYLRSRREGAKYSLNRREAACESFDEFLDMGDEAGNLRRKLYDSHFGLGHFARGSGGDDGDNY